jgi:hypothetical protein
MATGMAKWLANLRCESFQNFTYFIITFFDFDVRKFFILLISVSVAGIVVRPGTI